MENVFLGRWLTCTTSESAGDAGRHVYPRPVPLSERRSGCRGVGEGGEQEKSLR